MSRVLATISEVPTGLLHRPIEWFTAEHYRHRQFCALMHEIAESEVFEPEPIAAVLAFLRDELGRHLADEEADLFPLLRQRALPGDEVDQVLGRLTAEHKGDLAHGHVVRAHLETCLATRTAPGVDPAVALALDAFASQELRHLALENAVVLPLARLRLTSKDLGEMARRLAGRRGVTLADTTT